MDGADRAWDSASSVETGTATMAVFVCGFSLYAPVCRVLAGIRLLSQRKPVLSG